MKKYLAAVWFTLAATGVYAGEWDIVPNTELQYMGNVNEAQFANTGAWTGGGFRRVSKLPTEVTAAMLEALESYDLDVGDWFTFACGYEDGTPREIRVALRITQINRDGSYRYVFYAWQAY
jgi:hypothetical protein